MQKRLQHMAVCKFQQASSQVKDREGNTLTRKDDQLKNWAQYFNELQNRPPPPEVPLIPETSAKLNTNCESPSKEEIVQGKAAGPDNIPPEALKADANLTADILYSLFEKRCGNKRCSRNGKRVYTVRCTSLNYQRKVTAGSARVTSPFVM